MLETRLKCQGPGVRRGGWSITLVTLLALLSLAEAIMKYPPLMVKQPPANEELLFQVASGQSEHDKPFIIECEAGGKPAPKYTWHKNGKAFDWQIYDQRISQQPGRGTLVITSPREEDLGQYQCFATNELGVATSNSVFVRESKLDSFKLEDPLSVTVDEGEPASLRCHPPDGYPKPILYWMIQDDRGALRSINSTRKTVDPEGTLWFSNVTREDHSTSFKYACSATSSFRNEYKLGNQVFLKVREMGSTAVQIKNEPKRQFISRKNTTILKGRTLMLWCIFSGTPLPIIKWTKKDGILPIDRVDYEDYAKTLVIKHVTFEDAGTYECEASNGVGRAQSYTMNVVVDAIPYFTVEPEIQNKAEDETAAFQCEAEGKPKPRVYWIFNGKPISEAMPNPNRKITDNTIQIFNLTKSDTGNYGCNATNDHGYVYKDVYVNVLVKQLRALIRTNTTKFSSFSDIVLPCEIEGYPPPTTIWYHNNEVIEQSDRIFIALDNTLTIENAEESDAGTYKCEVSNQYSETSSSTTITIEDVYVHPSCTDNPHFANCKLTVKAKYCTDSYYTRFCCRSCTLAGQLPSSGSHLQQNNLVHLFQF